MKRSPDILFMITESCNCCCSFCSRNNLVLQKKEPLPELVKGAFTKLGEEFSQSKVIITGGEPSLSQNFLQYVNYAMSTFRKVEIQTNGTFSNSLSAKLQPLLKENLFIQFSLDGMQSYHDSIRGKGVFSKVEDKLRYFSEDAEHISISMTVTAENMQSALELAKHLNDFKFRRLSVSIVQPVNPLKEKLISKEEWNSFVDKLLTLCYYRVDISKLYDFEMMDMFLLSGQLWNGYTNCGRGSSHFYVTPSFDVLPCTCIDERVGNLYADDIREIKNRLIKASKITISEDSICHSCKYLSICNGGCPGISTKVFGVPNMGDIRCPFVLANIKQSTIMQ